MGTACLKIGSSSLAVSRSTTYLGPRGPGSSVSRAVRLISVRQTVELRDVASARIPQYYGGFVLRYFASASHVAQDIRR